MTISSGSDANFKSDCCFAANAARDTSEGTTKELLAACGRETPTLGVGERSFTSALIEELKAFGLTPFTVTTLHNRLVNIRWRLKYTPFHTILSEHGGTSVHLEPFPKPTSTVASPDGGRDSPSRPGAEDVVNQTRVLLAISVTANAVSSVSSWVNWLHSQAPPEITSVDAQIESVYDSHSTLVLISIAISAWDMLADKGAYQFIGFIRSGNRLDYVKVEDLLRELQGTTEYRRGVVASEAGAMEFMHYPIPSDGFDSLLLLGKRIQDSFILARSGPSPISSDLQSDVCELNTAISRNGNTLNSMLDRADKRTNQIITKLLRDCQRVGIPC